MGSRTAWRTWQGTDDYHEFWKPQRIQYGKQIFQYESCRWRHAGYRGICIVCRKKLYVGKTGDASGMCLEYSKDVMDIMTKLRKDWNLKYPNEEW